MEGTGANLRLPLNPPFFFESQIDYAPPGPAATIPGSRGCRRWTGHPASSAWDPNLRPQFTQQWNAYAEYLLGSRSSINIGYVGSKSKYLVTPIEGQPLPGTGPASTWRPLQERRPLYAFNPLITNISTTASRGRADYNALQTTFKQRCGMVSTSWPITPWARPTPTTSATTARAASPPRAPIRSTATTSRPTTAGVLRRAAHLLAGRQLRAAVRQRGRSAAPGTAPSMPWPAAGT